MDVTDTARTAIRLEIRQAVDESFVGKKSESAAGSAEIVFVRLANAEKLCNVFRAEAEILSEQFQRLSFCAREMERWARHSQCPPRDELLVAAPDDNSSLQ